jgi:hypothetical protein
MKEKHSYSAYDEHEKYPSSIDVFEDEYDCGSALYDANGDRIREERQRMGFILGLDL